MTTFRPMLNEISQDNNGDQSLRVDEEEIVIYRSNGDSSRDQKYRRHKDSYYRDKNNQIHGDVVRKLSMVIFLNDNLNQIYSLPEA